MQAKDKKFKIPQHVAIIMDGNGRWAKKKSLPKNAGHKKGAQSAKEAVKTCKKLGVEYLTLYTFSSENWNRPEKEVKALMDLLRYYLKNEVRELAKEGVKIRFIGNRDNLDRDIQKLMSDTEELTKNNEFNLILALSYGARDEIRSAAFKMAKDIANDINKDPKLEDFDHYLSTNGIPDPDLLIRTSGEYRISNFLLWQLAYAELYFTDVLWPDFKEKHLVAAIEDFNTRERRYGK